MSVVLLDAHQDWECPNCHASERVSPPLPVNAQRWHPCPRLHGLKAPMVVAGTDCTLVAVERADYLHGDEQRTGDDGRPYMAVETRYGDGHTDLAVFAPPAVIRFGR